MGIYIYIELLIFDKIFKFKWYKIYMCDRKHMLVRNEILFLEVY